MRHARNVWSDGTKAIVSKFGGEAVSIAAGGFSSAIVGTTLLREPYGSVESYLAENVVLPRLSGMDNFLTGFPSIDPPEEREARRKKPPEEQAHEITTKLLSIFGLPFIFGFAGQLVGNQLMFKALKMDVNNFRRVGITPRENLIISATDQALTLGGIFFMNKAMPQNAIEWQHGTQSFLEKIGFDKETAESRAAWLVNKQIPNAFAFLVSTYMTYKWMKD